MKKYIVLFVIFTFSLFSCSKSDDEVNTEFSIVGKWHTISAKTNGVAINLSSCDLYGYVEFSKNNSCVIESGYYQGSVCVHNTDNGTYTFTDNVLIFKEGSQYESRSRITELTATNFKSTTYYIKEGNNIDNVPVSEQTTFTVEKNN